MDVRKANNNMDVIIDSDDVGVVDLDLDLDLTQNIINTLILWI